MQIIKQGVGGWGCLSKTYTQLTCQPSACSTQRSDLRACKRTDQSTSSPERDREGEGVLILDKKLNTKNRKPVHDFFL